MTTPQITDDLIATQIRLEEEMTGRGADRYTRGVSRAIEKGVEDRTEYGKQIMAGRLDALAHAIADWKGATSKGRAGNRALAYKRVKDFSNDTLAYLTLKHVMAGISSVRTLQDVAVSIGSAVEDEMRFAEVRAAEAKTFEKLVLGAKKRTSAR